MFLCAHDLHCILHRFPTVAFVPSPYYALTVVLGWGFVSCDWSELWDSRQLRDVIMGM